MGAKILHNVPKFSALMVVLLVTHGCTSLSQPGSNSGPNSDTDIPNRFIHGTPGSWQGYQAYLRNPRLQSTAHMIAIDRLGFGESASSGPCPSFEVHLAGTII
ncbi:MAG: hypothetical protein GXP16_19605 [Gammaproteobacteria bacterium]|nr:hypothetical protein [Gammaproteobacteria bacterium]